MPKSATPSFKRSLRWTAIEAGDAILRQRSSWLSITAFAGREGLDSSRVRKWMKKLESSTALTTAPTFVEVARGARAPIEVVMPSGITLRVAKIGPNGARSDRARAGERRAVLSLPPSVRLYVAAQPVDGRKGVDSLMVIVRDVFRHDPFGGHLLVFFLKRYDRVRIVYWDRDGFATWTKRHACSSRPSATGTSSTCRSSDKRCALRGMGSTSRRKPSAVCVRDARSPRADRDSDREADARDASR